MAKVPIIIHPTEYQYLKAGVIHSVGERVFLLALMSFRFSRSSNLTIQTICKTIQLNTTYYGLNTPVKRNTVVPIWPTQEGIGFMCPKDWEGYFTLFLEKKLYQELIDKADLEIECPELDPSLVGLGKVKSQHRGGLLVWFKRMLFTTSPQLEVKGNCQCNSPISEKAIIDLIPQLKDVDCEYMTIPCQHKPISAEHKDAIINFMETRGEQLALVHCQFPHMLVIRTALFSRIALRSRFFYPGQNYNQLINAFNKDGYKALDITFR